MSPNWETPRKRHISDTADNRNCSYKCAQLEWLTSINSISLHTASTPFFLYAEHSVSLFIVRFITRVAVSLISQLDHFSDIIWIDKFSCFFFSPSKMSRKLRKTYLIDFLWTGFFIANIMFYGLSSIHFFLVSAISFKFTKQLNYPLWLFFSIPGHGKGARCRDQI